MASIENEARTLKYSLGQSSIIASRANYSNFQNLWDAEVKVFSQWGEDGILDFLCEKLGISKPRMLEVGAGNFRECNSRFLAENRNASVYLVDGRLDLITTAERDPLIWKNHLFAVNTWVTPENIQTICQDAANKMGGLDIFSLDIDGNDFWVLDSCPLEGVEIIVVEYNPLFGANLPVTVPRDDKFERRTKHYSCLYYGASLPAFISLLKDKDFAFIGTNRVGNNAFFIRSENLKKVSFKPSDDLSVYVDWRIRETRNVDGKLSFQSGLERVNEIRDLPLINLLNQTQITVIEAHEI
jgi:hypothetical protein